MEDSELVDIFKLINKYALSLTDDYAQAQFDVDRDIARHKIEAVQDLYDLFRTRLFNEVNEYDEWLKNA